MSVFAVFPDKFEAPFRHWYDSGDVPVASTLKFAGVPVVTVWDCGCVVMDGATGAAFTVRVAALDVALPTLFDTTQS